MLGILLGLLCGAVEFWLLKRLVDGVTAGAIPFWVIPAKMAALALFFVPCALIAPDQLHLCGIAAAGLLILLSVGLFVYRTRIAKATKNGSDAQ